MSRRHQHFHLIFSRLRRTMAARTLASASVLAAVIFIAWPEASPQATGAQQGQPQSQQPAQTPPDTPQQPATPEGQQPVFRTGINFVRVDVIVTDRNGAPVDDLQAADFEVIEDGKPQVVESFKLVKVTGTPEAGSEPAREIRSDSVEESEAARDDVRLFAIFLDDYHVRRGASMGVREPLMKFLQTQVAPLDMVALMYPLTPVSDLRFTRNHDGMARAIEQFLGRKFEYEPKNDFEQQYSNYPTEVVERVRNQVSLSALKGLATRMGGLREGRKAIIVVSEGYSYYVPPQLRSDNATMGAPIGRRNPMLGENNPNEQRAAFFSDSDMQLDLRLVYDAANRANTALYTLDPRGLAVFEYDINEAVGMKTDQQVLQSTQDTLRVLAEQTDGRAIVNRNDLEGGLRQIVKDSSAYYLIGYNSSQAPTDGKFHEIKVRVKRQRVDVRARKGYWALTPEETARATAPPKPEVDRGVTNALAAVEAPNRARVIRAGTLYQRRIRFISGQTGAAQNVIGPMQDWCYPNPGGVPYGVARWSELAPIFGDGAALGFVPQYHTQGWFFRYAGGSWQSDALYTPNTSAYDQTYPAAQYNVFNGQTKYRDPTHVFNGIITDVGGEPRMVVWTSGRVLQYRANQPLGAQQLAADRPYLTGGRLDAEGRSYGLTIEDPASGYVILLAGTDAVTVFEDWKTCFQGGCALVSDPDGGIARHVSIYNPATNLVDDRFYSYANANGNYYRYRGRLVYPANPLVRIPGPASRLAYNVYDNGHWNLHISGPGSTSDRHVIRDRFLWDIRDFDGDGVDEWITSPICETPLCPETEGWYLPRRRIDIYRWEEASQSLISEPPSYDGVLPYLSPTFRRPKASTSRGALYPVMSVQTGEGLKMVVTSDGTAPRPLDD